MPMTLPSLPRFVLLFILLSVLLSCFLIPISAHSPAKKKLQPHNHGHNHNHNHNHDHHHHHHDDHGHVHSHHDHDHHDHHDHHHPHQMSCPQSFASSSVFSETAQHLVAGNTDAIQQISSAVRVRELNTHRMGPFSVLISGPASSHPLQTTRALSLALAGQDPASVASSALHHNLLSSSPSSSTTSCPSTHLQVNHGSLYIDGRKFLKRNHEEQYETYETEKREMTNAIADYIHKCPHGVIIVDAIESASPLFLESFVSVLHDTLPFVFDKDGNKVSTEHAIVLFVSHISSPKQVSTLDDPSYGDRFNALRGRISVRIQLSEPTSEQVQHSLEATKALAKQYHGHHHDHVYHHASGFWHTLEDLFDVMEFEVYGLHIDQPMILCVIFTVGIIYAMDYMYGDKWRTEYKAEKEQEQKEEKERNEQEKKEKEITKKNAQPEKAEQKQEARGSSTAVASSSSVPELRPRSSSRSRQSIGSGDRKLRSADPVAPQPTKSNRRQSAVIPSSSSQAPEKKSQ